MSHGSAGRAHLRRQAEVTRQQPLAVGENHRALHGVLQLADVARPGVFDQHRQRFGRERHLLADVARDALDEMMRELRDVFLAIAQRRNRDRKHRQPEIEVLAELARRHRLPQHAVRRRDDADVDRESSALPPSRSMRLVSIARSIFACSASGISPISSRKMVPRCAISNLPILRCVRAGEGAALVAEQLRLEQVLGNRRAVDRDERAVGARRWRCAARARTTPCRCRSRLRAAPSCRCRRRDRSRPSPAATPASRR